MSIKAQIKLVAMEDIHLKQGTEIDATITVPDEHLMECCTTQINDSLVLMVGGPLPSPTEGATGYFAMKALGIKDYPRRG